MKRVILLTVSFFLLSHQSLFSQLLPLLETGKVWHACVGFAEWSPSQITLKVDKDTIIGNYTYKQVRENIFGSIWDSPDTVVAGWIREDSLGKVYFLANGLKGDCMGNDTTETLLYDFSVTENDTVFYSNSWSVIEKVDSIVANGVSRRIWLKGQSYNACNYWYDTIIEGIGSTKGLLYPRWGEFENVYSLKCVDTNAVQIYPESACVCQIGLSINAIKPQAVSIFPNPCSTSFQIQMDNQPTEPTYLLVFNTIGDLVKRQSITASSTTVMRGNLASGMYVWQLTSGNTIFAKGKVVLH